MQRIPIVHDNSDVQEIHDGRITDMRIEVVLACIYDGKWDEPELDTLYTEIVQEFVSKDTPTLLVSSAGKNPHQAHGLLFLSLFGLDYEITHRNSPYWPGDFDYMPKASCAVRCRYPDDDENFSEWTPGISPSCAAIAALMQVCRELSLEIYNGGSDVVIN